MKRVGNFIRRNAVGVAVVAVTVAAAFVVGLVVGGQRSGSAAEWAGGAGAFAAAVVALAIATQTASDSRDDRRRHWVHETNARTVDLLGELLLVINKDKAADDKVRSNATTASLEGAVLVARIGAAGQAQLGLVADHYSGDPGRQRHGNLDPPAYWAALREVVTDAIRDCITRQYEVAAGIQSPP